MTIFRSEDELVGLIALALIPWIGWTVRRGLKYGKLPIGRSYVRRDERPGVYRALLGLWVAIAVMSAIIGLDLLFGFDGWFRL